MDRKDNIVAKINELMIELRKLDDSKSCSIFLFADPIREISKLTIQGDTQILSRGFHTNMNSNVTFNSFMKATFGSYLLDNPDQKDDFLNGLGLITDFTFNPN